MKVAQAISRALVSEGVTLAAGIAGQSIWPVIDAIGDCERDFADVCAPGARRLRHLRRFRARRRQAGGGVHRCRAGGREPDGRHRQFLGRFGAGAVLRRPQRAHQDRRKYTKELPFLDIFGPVSKWSAMVDDPVQGRRSPAPRLHAYAHRPAGAGGARHAGRRLPRWRSATSNTRRCRPRPRVRSGADPAAIERALDADRRRRAALRLCRRRRAVLGGDRRSSCASPSCCRCRWRPRSTARAHFRKTIRWRSASAASAAPPTARCRRPCWRRIADVILTIGCGFKQHATIVRPSQRIKHIQVDVDPVEINRDHVADVAILGDAKVVLRQLVEAAKSRLPARAACSRSHARTQQIEELRGRNGRRCAQPLLYFRGHADQSVPRDARVHGAGRSGGDHRSARRRHGARHHLAALCRDASRARSSASACRARWAGRSAPPWAPRRRIPTSSSPPSSARRRSTRPRWTSRPRSATTRRSWSIVKNNRKIPDIDGGKSKKLAVARFQQGVDICALATALGAKAYRVEKPGEIARTLSRPRSPT